MGNFPRKMPELLVLMKVVKQKALFEPHNRVQFVYRQSSVKALLLMALYIDLLANPINATPYLHLISLA